MDVIQDWANQLLGDHGHPALYLLAPYTRQLTSILNTAQSFLLPLINQVLHKPDLTTIALLIIILFISLKLLNILWQTFIFWVRMAARLVFWGGLAALGVWMYTRGADGVAEDVGYWYGVWNKDYEYWRERERVARMVSHGRAMGGNKARGSWF